MLKIGDKVKGVKFKEGTYPSLGFDEVMENYIGVVGIVSQIDSMDYVEVEFEEESYWYPMQLLTREN